MKPRHFLTLLDLTAAELKRLMKRARELKAMHQRGKRHTPLTGKTMAMIFEKSSTRTRVSYEAGMAQLGGTPRHETRRQRACGGLRVLGCQWLRCG